MPSHLRPTLASHVTRATTMRCIMLLFGLALAVPRTAAAQSAAPLSKSDLVRYLSSTTYSKSELAGIIRRSCLAFTPTARDRDDLRALGATGEVMTAIDACAKGGNRSSSPERAAATTSTTRQTRSTPRTTGPAPYIPMRLTLPQTTLTAVAGDVVSIDAQVRRGDTPASGVRLMLHGVEQIPGGARQAVVASTDATGHAVFSLPSGTTAGTYRLTIESANDAEVQGDATVVLVTTAASPTSADVSPSVIQLDAKTPARQEVSATVHDPFGNAAAFQRVELRPAHEITGIAALSATTDSSGVVRFQLPTAPLHDDDTLVVAVGDRALARIPVSAASQVTSQLLEAARLVAEGRLADAEAAYDTVLRAEPNNVRALLARGAIRSLARKDETARQDFLTVLHIDSTNTAALVGLGYSFARSGEYTRAQRRFEEALQRSPKQSDAETGLAYATLWQYDSKQAARRSDVLNTIQPTAYPADVAARFRTGVDDLRKKNLPGAQYAFSAVIAAAPSWPEAYYNRALVYEAEGRPERGIADLRKYLELRPAASDRDAVARRIDAVGGNPHAVLTRGLLLPGLGQMSTGRPVIGLAVLGGVAASLAWALQTETTTETRQFQDPFGNPYSDQVPVEQRPHLATGAALAASVWVLGALEAYLHTKSAVSGGSGAASAKGGHTAKSQAAGPHLMPVMTFGPSGPAFGAGVAIPFR